MGWSFAAAVGAQVVTLAFIFGCLALLEMAAPRSVVSMRSRLVGGLFWVVYLIAGSLIMLPVAFAIDALNIQPVLPSLAIPGLPPFLAAVFAGISAAVLADLFYYWAHRLQHAVPLLWRLHATHHSVRELSAATSYHHVLEHAMKAILYGVPIAFVTPDPYALPVVGGLISILGYYLHSPTQLNFGPLNRLIVDNRFHRIHHSRDPAHFDKNFGVVTPVWDILFGTAYFPKPGEWPETGLADWPPPATVWTYLVDGLGRPDRGDGMDGVRVPGGRSVADVEPAIGGVGGDGGGRREG